MKMKKGFTFIEIMCVTICLCILIGFGVNGFKNVRARHMVESTLQELSVLRTAFLAYHEKNGTLPNIDFAALDSENFSPLKPFWYPFRPESSKVIEGGKWYGKVDKGQGSIYLELKKGENCVPMPMDMLTEKAQAFCRIDASDNEIKFYVLDNGGDIFGGKSNTSDGELGDGWVSTVTESTVVGEKVEKEPGWIVIKTGTDTKKDEKKLGETVTASTSSGDAVSSTVTSGTYTLGK